MVQQIGVVLVEEDLLAEAGTRFYVEDLRGLHETVKHLRAELAHARLEFHEAIERLNQEGITQVDLGEALGMRQADISKIIVRLRARRARGNVR
jgi:DNA-binding MarR family transcriptional regulator